MTFYLTLFRQNTWAISPFCRSYFPFLSHTVQTKRYMINLMCPKIYTFYLTLFRQNWNKKIYSKFCKYLSISHCSDKTYYTRTSNNLTFQVYFLSHTVQTKPVIKGIQRRIDEFTFYLTLFRQNATS